MLCIHGLYFRPHSSCHHRYRPWCCPVGVFCVFFDDRLEVYYYLQTRRSLYLKSHFSGRRSERPRTTEKVSARCRSRHITSHYLYIIAPCLGGFRPNPNLFLSRNLATQAQSPLPKPHGKISPCGNIAPHTTKPLVSRELRLYFWSALFHHVPIFTANNIAPTNMGWLGPLCHLRPLVRL